MDVPSGIDASARSPGRLSSRKLTVTFHAPKVGLVVAPGRYHAGRLVVADIGLERDNRVRRVAPAVLEAVPRRKVGDSKYTAGSVLVVGGQPGTTGERRALSRSDGRAPRAVPATWRSRCRPKRCRRRRRPTLEPVKIPWREENAVETSRRGRGRATALALGPGLGRGPQRAALVRELLGKLDLPAVVDADALFELEPVEREAPTVLLPAPGSSAACSAGTPSGWTLTGSPPFERPRSASAPSSC